MTTPTASAVVSLESAELPRNNSARSAGPVSSTSDRGTRSGPVDLDETQQTIDSETAVETNNNPSARDGAHEQNAGVPSGTDVVMQNLLDDMVSTLIVASIFCSYSPKSNISFNTSPHSLLLPLIFMSGYQTKHFDQMGQTILGRIDEMGSRIDDVERTIGDLMNQAGLEPSIGNMPASSLPENAVIGEQQDAESTASV